MLIGTLDIIKLLELKNNMLRTYLAKCLLNLNRSLANNLNLNLYFFFVKFIYPLFLLEKIDFSLKFLHDKKKKITRVKSSHSKTGYYYNLERSNRYIFGGFDGLGKKLFEKYQLNEVSIKEKDIVIEIGCNIGELTSYISRFKPFIYAFDIENKVLDCLRLNCKYYKKIKIQKMAIWKKSGTINFESKLNEASSSLLISNKNKNKNKSNIHQVKAITLNNLLHRNKIDKVKLIKVEAEGGEPEILQGALKILNKVEYIALDCGPERYGKKTIKAVSKILKKNNFRVNISENYCLGINNKLVKKNV